MSKEADLWREITDTDRKLCDAKIQVRQLEERKKELLFNLERLNANQQKGEKNE